MARKIKRKKKSGSEIKTIGMLNILRRVHLGGAINECVVEISKGVGKIEAVDITNSIICIAGGRVASKDISEEFGLGNVELLIKFLSTIEDEELSAKSASNVWTLKRNDGRRKMDYLLTNADLIGTNLKLEEEDDDPYEKMSEMMEYKAELTSTLIKDFLKFIGLLSTSDVTIIFDGEEELIFRLGAKDDHQIELSLSAEIEGEEGDGFQITINGEHLSKVFSVLEYDEDDPPTIGFADNEKPVMIESGDSAWFLLPLSEEYEEEDE